MRRSAAPAGTMNINSRRVQAGRRQIHAATMMQHKTTANGRAKLPTGRPRIFSQKAGKIVTATPVTGARNRALSGCMFGSTAAISDQPRPVQKTSKTKVRACGSNDMSCIYDTHKDLSTRPKPRPLKSAAWKKRRDIQATLQRIARRPRVRRKEAHEPGHRRLLVAADPSA